MSGISAEASGPLIRDPKRGHLLWLTPEPLNLVYLVSVEEIKEFFEGLKRGKLLGVRCGQRLYFPPRPFCPDGSRVEWVELPREGSLIAFTVITAKPQTFSGHSDYAVGLAELENGVKVLAWIRAGDYRRLRVGMRVRVDFERRAGNYVTYVLKPVSEELSEERY